MKIAVGSENKAKKKAVETVVKKSGIDAEIISIDAPSNVSGMPFSDEETMRGAINRAEYCLGVEGVDLGFGLEGGVTETPFGIFVINWGALAVRGRETIVAGGARFRLPDEIADRLRAGEELGPVMDEYAHKENVRHHEGAIGIFTAGYVNRGEMFSHIVKVLIGQYRFRN